MVLLNRNSCFVLFLMMFIFLISSCTEETKPKRDSHKQVKKVENHDLDIALIKCLSSDSISIDSIQLLLDQGADINYTYQTTEKSIIRKVGPKKPVIAQFLRVKTSEYLDTFTYSGIHELLERNAYNKMDALIYILNHGADPNIVGTKGLMPLETFALAHHQKGNVHDYRTSVPDFETPDRLSMNFVDTLVHYGADAKRVNLKYARGAYGTLSTLLKHGADPKTIDPTDLFMDIIWYNDEAKNNILSYPIDYSSLDLSKMRVEEMFIENLRTMLENGFDGNKPMNGVYPLGYAIEESDEVAVKLLLDYKVSRVSINPNEDPYDWVEKQRYVEDIVRTIVVDFGYGR